MLVIHDSPPRFDIKNFATLATQQFRLLLVDRKQWVKVQSEAFADKAHFVVETICSEEEFRHAPYLARMERQFRLYDIYGRKRGSKVELFADVSGRVPKDLYDQYQTRGCSIGVIPWPQCFEDSFHTILNNAIMANVVAQTNETLDFAIVTTLKSSETLSVIPCGESLYQAMIVTVRNGSPLQDRGFHGVTLLALVRRNHIMWTCDAEVFLHHVPSFLCTKRIECTYSKPSKSEERSSTNVGEWAVPLIVPEAIRHFHDKRSKNAKRSHVKKQKTRQAKQESINALEIDTLEWLNLPHGRKVSVEEIERMKRYVHNVAARRTAREPA